MCQPKMVYSHYRRKGIVGGGGGCGHDKENFLSGIIFLGYKSHFPEKWETSSRRGSFQVNITKDPHKQV